MKRPAFQFYPADWRKDVELRSCSMAARGLWIDILCVMHECDPYGHLIINGKPMKAAGLVNHIGGSEAQIKKLLLELIDNGVARLTAEGAIYSKRMVEDEDLRVRRANGGYEGAEHGIKGKDFGSLGGRGGEFDGPGILYAVQRVAGGAIKIGVTRHIKQRLSAMRGKLGEPIELLGTSKVRSMRDAEAYMLSAFDGRRDGEWVNAEWGEVRDALSASPHPPFEPPPSSSSSSSASTNTSEPNGSGGEPPPMSAIEIIFCYGVPLLVSAGSTDKAARSFLGGLRKGHRDDELVDALRDCLKAKPLQPLEWLAAALPPKRSARNGNHAEPDWVRERRERTQEAAPYAAVGGRPAKQIFDIEEIEDEKRILPPH